MAQLDASEWIDMGSKHMEPCMHVYFCIQQQSKVCIQTCALLYIAAFCCTPNCHGIVSQLITGKYVIKFERNSFRVQLSARGIATCFALAQPQAQVSRGVDCLCLPSKSKSQIATTLANFLAPASDSTENRGLLVAQALLQLTAKLAQQANSLSSVKMLWLTAHCFAAQSGDYKRNLACFYRQHCPLEACLPIALACCCAANLPSADNSFPRSTHGQGQSSAASATDDICRTGPTYTRVRWFTTPTWPYRQSD